MEDLYKCECKEKLMFNVTLEVIDIYDNKALVKNEYFCPSCGNEYTINDEEDLKDPLVAGSLEKWINKYKETNK